MENIDLKKFYERQISLSEWFDAMGHEEAEAVRLEDNEKRERLKILNEVIGLPFDKPYQFSAFDIASRTPIFESFLKDHGDELFALRLIPKDPSFPKLRMRGYCPEELLKWFQEQNIDPAKYRADFVPHPKDSLWATIFIVNPQGVYGEIIKGGHNQLTQGFYAEDEPIAFSFDFSSPELTHKDLDAKTHLNEILEKLYVEDFQKQKLLFEKLSAKFANGYLCGYFETYTSTEFGLWFIDYNRILGEMYKDFSIPPSRRTTSVKVLRGQTGSFGKAVGKVRIIQAENLTSVRLKEGDVLVCEMTTPEYLPLMKAAGAIVTDLGGILSHPAIIARELKKPCIVGTKIATTTLEDGMLVEVDADNAVVRILQ